jgi:hypothetical protein
LKKLFTKKKKKKNRTGGVAQGEGPEVKPQNHTKKKEAKIGLISTNIIITLAN